MTPASIFVLDLFVKSVILLLVAHLIALSVRRASAGGRHLIISSAIIALLVLPVATAMLGVIEVPVVSTLRQTAPIPAERLLFRTTSDEASDAGVVTDVAASDGSVVPEAVETTASASVSDEGTTRTSTVSLPLISFDSILAWVRASLTPPVILVGVWLVGAIALLAHLMVGVARVQWIVDRSLPLRDPRTLDLVRETTATVGLEKEPVLLISPDLSVPVVWGFTSPVLLLPIESEQWSDDRRKAVLLHELAHIVRRDGLTLILMKIAIALYWINPLVWTAGRMSRRYCERACDDIVLERGTRASEYADHLLAIARTLPERERLATVTLAMSRRSEIEGRLLAILHPDLRRSTITRRTSIAAAVMAAALVVVVSSVRITAQEPRHDNASDKTVEDLWLEEILSPDLEVSVGEESAIEVNADSDSNTNWNTNTNTNWNTNWNTNTNTNWSSNDDQQGDSDGDRTKKRDAKRDDRNRKSQTLGARLWEEAWNAHQEARFEESIPLFMRTAEIGHRREASLYNVACGYAMQGDATNAVTWLERAVEAGFDDWSLLSSDSDLDPIRSEGTFRQFVESTIPRDRGKRSRTRLEKVTENYETLRARRSTDASDWSEAGRQLLGLRQFPEAETALRRSIELSREPAVIAMYNMACLESLRGNDSAALAWLDKAIDSGLDRTEKMTSDPDLASIRGTTRFAQLVQKSKLLSVGQFMDGQKDKESVSENRARWEPAVTIYSQYVSSHPDSGRGWWNLAWAQHASAHYEKAINSFERALGLGYRPANSSYNIACGYARLGHRDLAFQWLERAAAHGFEMGDRIDWDEDLASLRGDRRAETLFDRKHDS